MVCSTAGMTVISCRGRVRLQAMPLLQQKRWNMGDAGVMAAGSDSWTVRQRELGKNGKPAAAAEE